MEVKQMKNSQKVLENGSFVQLLLHLSAPAVVLMLVMVVYNMADTYFIGQMNDPNMLAAVSLCAPVFSIITGLGTLFGSGACTLISISLGANETNRIKAASSFCMICSLGIGIIAMIAGQFGGSLLVGWLGATGGTQAYASAYFRIFICGAPATIFSVIFCNVIRGDGSAAQSMIANLIGSVSNIILDALFVLVFRWGVEGAALATVIGNCMACIYLLRYIRKSELLSLNPRHFLQNKAVAIKVLSLGIPMACSTVLMSISNIISNYMMIGYGETALAAQGVAGKIGMLTSMLVMGICIGLQPAFSYAYGKRDLNRIGRLVRSTAVFTFLLGTIFSILGFIFRTQLVHAFINNQEVIRYGGVMIFGSLLTGPFIGWYQLCQTFLQSTGKSGDATLVALLDKGLVYMPVLFLMAKVFGLYGIAFTGAVTMTLSLAVGIAFSIRWYHSWTRGGDAAVPAPGRKWCSEV